MIFLATYVIISPRMFEHNLSSCLKKKLSILSFQGYLNFLDCDSKCIAFTIKSFSNNSYLSKRCVFTCKEHVGSSKFRDWLSWKTWLFTAWRIAVSFAWIKRSGQHSILKLSNLKRNNSSICSYVFLKLYNKIWFLYCNM